MSFAKQGPCGTKVIPDIATHIALYLDIGDVLNLCLTCRAWRDSLYEEGSFRRILRVSDGRPSHAWLFNVTFRAHSSSGVHTRRLFAIASRGEASLSKCSYHHYGEPTIYMVSF